MKEREEEKGMSGGKRRREEKRGDEVSHGLINIISSIIYSVCNHEKNVCAISYAKQTCGKSCFSASSRARSHLFNTTQQSTAAFGLLPLK